MKPRFFKTTIDTNVSTIGQTIETRVQRMKANKEPITDGAPLIYTERKDGVLAGYNIRTDRFDIAVEFNEKEMKSKAAKRASMSIVKDESLQDDQGKEA